MADRDITLDFLTRSFEAEGYIADRELLLTVYLALRLEKPLLVTGAPGVGKTEIAKVLSSILGTELIRLQCYEGLDEAKALYEWNYQRQLLKIQMVKDGEAGLLESDLFSREYLLARPLLKAIQAPERVVLLIDEIDKTDEEFEAFLFELLSDFQVSIPEMGTLKAREIPVVVLTSNGERELSDGLKRRCLFLHIGYPSPEKELRIIRARVPEADENLALQVATAVQILRKRLDLKKPPAIAETLDWARALLTLGFERLSPDAILETRGVFFKDQEDVEAFEGQMKAEGLFRAVTEELA